MRKYLFPVRLHPLFILMMVYAFFGNFFWPTVRLFIVVLLHELGHSVVALRLGYQIESLELYPFGGVARLTGKNVGWNPRDEALIAVSGPLVNLVLALIFMILLATHTMQRSVADPLIGMNMTLFFFNLLPALPLDGGRIARATLSTKKGFEKATEVLTRMSFLFSVILMIMGAASLWLGYTESGMLILGIFLFVSAFTIRKQNRYETLRFLDHKRRDMMTAQPLRTLVVHHHTGIGQVASQFIPGAYHVIYVQAKDTRGDFFLSLQDPIQESDILKAIFEEGMWKEPIVSLLR